MIDRLTDAFEHIQLAPAEWPVHVDIAMPGRAAVERWPDFPVDATLERGRVGQGHGATVAESRRRAAAEMIETASCCAWGDEPVVEARPSGIGGEAWSAGDMTGFADWQRRDRDSWNERMSGLDWIPPAAEPDAAIGWLEARRLDRDAEVFVPADCVLIGRRESGDPQACAVADSNGCAAGETDDDAILAGLYELIERDATGRWWYGGAPGRDLDLDKLGLGEVEQHLAGRKRALTLFDITSDIGVPTVAALGATYAGRHVAAGFATRGKLAEAVQSAVSELLQMELKVAIALAHPDQAMTPDLKAWFCEIDLNWEPPYLEERTEGGSREVDGAGAGLAGCLAALDRAGCRVAAIRLTRACFGVPVWRVLSPDLCHWKPRFGRRRLVVDEDITEAMQRHPLLRV